MQYDNLTVQQKQNLLTITIQTASPKENYLDKATTAELAHVLEHMPDVHAVMFRGTRKAFSLGAAINQFSAGDSIRKFVERGQQLFQKIHTLPCITIAAVEGYALGGGFELALACDMIVASDRARFGLVESNIGVMPGWGGFFRLARRIGVHRSLEWVLSGAIMQAEQALSLGIIQQMFPRKEFDSSLDAFLASFIHKPKVTIHAIKKAFLALGEGTGAEEYSKLEARLFARLWQNQDVQDMLKKFRGQ